MPVIGDIFGLWTVIGPDERIGKYYRVPCRCACGVERNVVAQSLVIGRSKSCGCAPKLRLDALSHRPEYHVWENIKGRCLNPNNRAYKYYGGRGITICAKWLQFSAFYEDMGPRPNPDLEVDRIDSNKGYQPDNCRWATRKEQQNNMRSNRYLTIGGRRQTVSQWADETGTNRAVMYERMNRGWPDIETVFGRNGEIVWR